MISATIPMTPPSVNTYVRHTRLGQHFKTREAEGFMQLVALGFRGQSIRAKAYSVLIGIVLGKGEKLDVDNAPKCCLDALVRCGAIDTDAKVIQLTVVKSRDWKNPRTEIRVSAHG